MRVQVLVNQKMWCHSEPPTKETDTRHSNENEMELYILHAREASKAEGSGQL